MPLFLFIFHILWHTYTQSIAFIQYIYPSPFAGASLLHYKILNSCPFFAGKIETVQVFIKTEEDDDKKEDDDETHHNESMKSEVDPWQLLETDLVEEDDPIALAR